MSDCDPWLLRGTDPDDPQWRDPWLGNGLIGQRISPQGDGGAYAPESASFMAGLWGAARENPKRPQGLIELPRWAWLEVRADCEENRRPIATREDFSQELDLKSGICTTRYFLRHGHGGLQVQQRVWLCRHLPEVAVLELRIERPGGDDDAIVGSWGRLDGRFEIHEGFDASDWSDLAEGAAWESGQDLGLEVSADSGAQLACTSRLLWSDETVAKPVACRVNDRRVHRRWRGVLQRGESLTVHRLVALVPGDRDPHPPTRSRALIVEASANDVSALEHGHKAAWAALWEHHIEVDQPELQRVINASLYQLYATLRHDVHWSHGPCALAGNGWDGLVFWDTDTWTLPIFALFAPELAKSCVAYRHRCLPAARANAEANGEVGARWPWMSGADGSECCSIPTFQNERHIVSCVALAQWLYAVCAGDSDWLTNEGLAVIRGSAEYWAGWAEANDDGSWSIRQVCGSDEDAGIVDDNATTNTGAAWTLRLAHRLVSEAEGSAPDAWLAIADGLRLPWDDERGIPLQMEGWQHGQRIKQADAVMMVHPWNRDFDAETMAKMVDYYRAHYPPQAIMMGAAIDGVVDARLGRSEGVGAALEALMPHFRGPFLIPSEHPQNERVPFVTGLGGLLQLLVFGAAGVRIDDKGFHSTPCLPPGIGTLTLKGIFYDGTARDLVVKA